MKNAQRVHFSDALQVKFTGVPVWGLYRNAHCRVREFAAMLVATSSFANYSTMQHVLKSALPLVSALALGLLAVPALADSTSSASSASSTSIGSSSASVEKSSDSSSTKDKVAQGPYTVVEMTALADQPDMLRLRLQPVMQVPDTLDTPIAGEFVLLLPRPAAERGQLVVGQVVSVAHRSYGVAFTAVTTTSSAESVPFFLMLDDAWFGELQSRPLGV